MLTTYFSETIRNTLDPKWHDSEGITYNFDRRIDLGKPGVLLRIEVWDWDFGGDDADDLLGQYSLRGEEISNLLAISSSRAVQSATATDPPQEHFEGISYNDPGEVERAVNRGKAMSVGAVKNEIGMGAKMPCYVQKYTLQQQAEDHEREDLEKIRIMKKRKPTRSVNRATGTIDFGIRVETSEVSADAKKLARAEALAQANAFELWPLLTVANMSHNRLQSLPRACRGWKIMKRLNLAGNLLSELPDEFCTCSMLEGES